MPNIDYSALITSEQKDADVAQKSIERQNRKSAINRVEASLRGAGIDPDDLLEWLKGSGDGDFS